MTASDWLNEILAGSDTPPRCEQGSEFRTLELEGTVDLSPAQRAIWSGLNADRPAWVFAGGYQAALRACLPELEGHPGWLAFVVSDGEPPMGLHLDPEGNEMLSGVKNWVAAADCVNWLVVSARQAAGKAGQDHAVSWCLLKRSEVEAFLEVRKAPSFLPALAQGRLRLDGFALPAGRRLQFLQAHRFAAIEAQMVTLAGAAALLALRVRCGLETDLDAAGEVGDDPAKSLAKRLAAVLSELDAGDRPVETLAQLDQAMQANLAEFEAQDITFGPAEHWAADRRVFSLYSSGIAKRAAAKKAS